MVAGRGRDVDRIPGEISNSLSSPDTAGGLLRHGAYGCLPEPYDPEDLRISVRRAVENRRLRLGRRLRNPGMNAVVSIAKALTTTVKPGEILEIIRDQTWSLVGCDRWALAQLKREDRFWDLMGIATRWGGGPRPWSRLPLEHPFFAPILAEHKPHWVEDLSVSSEADDWDLPFLVGVRSYFLVPLVTRDRLAGALFFGSPAVSSRDQADPDLLGLVANQVALAVDNAHLMEQNRQSGRYLEQVLNAAENTAIISIDREGRTVTFNSGAERIFGLAAAQAVGRDITEIVGNTALREVFCRISKEPDPEGWEGQIRIERPDRKSFWGNLRLRPIDPCLGFLVMINDVTRRVELENRLKQLTVTDDLTGLYNQRDLFEQLRREMERANRSRSACSLCVFDLDHFKDYNDTHGHVAGDRLLRALGGIVSRTIRAKIDRAFRYGGDEFVLLLPDTDLTQATILVDRLRRVISEEFAGTISISAGIAEYSPGMGDKDFIESADQLMYLAKRSGGDRVELKIARRQTSP